MVAKFIIWLIYFSTTNLYWIVIRNPEQDWNELVSGAPMVHRRSKVTWSSILYALYTFMLYSCSRYFFNGYFATSVTLLFSSLYSTCSSCFCSRVSFVDQGQLCVCLLQLLLQLNYVRPYLMRYLANCDCWMFVWRRKRRRSEFCRRSRLENSHACD